MAQLTILIPVGPSHPFLAECLASVLEDIDERASILCVFDGCAPEPEVKGLIESSGTWISVHKQTSLGAVLNLGLARIDTPLVSRLDADDLWAQGRLDAQLQVMFRNPGFAAVGGNARLMDSGGNLAGSLTMGRTRRLGRSMLIRNQVIHPSVVLRCSAVEAAGGYPEVRRVEDYLLWLRLMSEGTVAHCASTWVTYRRHEDQEISTSIPASGMRRVELERVRLARRRGWGRILPRVAHRAWSIAQGRRTSHLSRIWAREVRE